MNDSFYPTIDGVATAVLNYATTINETLGETTVITPRVKGTKYDFPFKVCTYTSIPYSRKDQYVAGMPFSKKLHQNIRNMDLDIIHAHTPLASGFLANAVLKDGHKVPMVLTYHTKFDYDFNTRLPFQFMRNWFIKLILLSANVADEVWVVSEGAGESLRSLGYTGNYTIMPNGVDFPKGKVDCSEISKKHQLQDDVPVFLFAGRLMWYKNLRLILDSLKALKDKGFAFQFLVVGSGTDGKAIEKYTKKLGLSEETVFVGRISDREELRAYYSRADLFLFPSLFDSHGIVVREAAACECPSLLIKGSSAAYGIQDGVSGYLCDENPQSFSDTIIKAFSDKGQLQEIGKNAAKDIYLSWEDAVTMAYRRYEEICEAWDKPLPYRNKTK